jgi:hypothetical protein
MSLKKENLPIGSICELNFIQDINKHIEKLWKESKVARNNGNLALAINIQNDIEEHCKVRDNALIDFAKNIINSLDSK